jgi:2-dehydro-3-deoxyphosphooctonate aldolase (KDO 8-P synthase)
MTCSIRDTAASAHGSVGRLRIGAGQPLVLFAGPCVIESEAHAMRMAERLVKIAARRADAAVFKASYDKANRSSHFFLSRAGAGGGPGCAAQDQGALWAFRCSPTSTSRRRPRRRGSLRRAASAGVSFAADRSAAGRGQHGRVVNLKKGQFLSPWEMGNAVQQGREHRKSQNSFDRARRFVRVPQSRGGHALVCDHGQDRLYPVVFDVTHSVQLPGGQGTASGGQPEFIEPLARAGCAAGVDAIFLEVHDRPARALSDGSNALPLDRLPRCWRSLQALGKLVRSWRRLDEPGNRAPRLAHRGPSH